VRKANPLSLALLLLIFLLISLACEYNPTIKWAGTVVSSSATPSQTPTIDQTMVGRLNIMVDKKEIRFVLDPLGERNINGILTSVIDLGTTYLAETSDPHLRYLPSVAVFAKDREPMQQVDAVQIGSEWQWSLKTANMLEASLLKTDFLGSYTLGTVHTMPELRQAQFGFNLIMPVPTAIDDNQAFDVYRTPGSITFLLLPPGFSSGGSAHLAAPALQAAFLDPYLVLSFLAVPQSPVSDYLRSISGVEVTNYLGISSDAYAWALLKVKESPNGMPVDYVPPNGISPEVVNWINYDASFVRALYFIGTERSDVLCTDQTKLDTVIAQDIDPGVLINALNQKMTLSYCNEVVSQSKYETLTYTTATPTITLTPTLTNTPAPTVTLTPSITPTRTSTPRPTNTTRATNTTAPTITRTNAPSLAPTVPTSTTGPTNTPTPNVWDEFNSSPNGYNASTWNLVDSGTGTRTWRSGENTLQQEIFGASDYNFSSVRSCLFGIADFRIKTYENTSGYWMVGWMDTTTKLNILNGVWISSSSDPANLTFTLMAYGASQSLEVPVSSRDTIWHAYRIAWAMNTDGSYTVAARLYLDGSSTPAASFTSGAPDMRLPFIISTFGSSTPGDGDAWVDLDYIRVNSSSCQ
jgi:hypothetical protein